MEVEEKARLDGEYAECLQKGGWTAFAKDMQCFFRTIDSVLKHDGVREGGTGEKKAADALNSSVDDLYRAANPPLRKDAAIDNIPIKVLIVGEGSYIGTKVEEYLNSFEKRYEVRTLRTRNLVPSPFMFENYDSIFFVAGIAHRRETKKNRDLYYQVNYDLAVNVAQEAKRAKVPHFIILSSIAVYGMETGYISKNTKTAPKNHYGKSKRMADNAIWKLRDDCFRVAILRPPMVYGKGCKGNYQLLRKAAVRLFLFPEMKNRRSMIYIENLCEFVKETIDNKKEGIFFPQNKDYINTSDMVKLIALSNGKKVRSIRFLNPLIKKWPLRILKKVFGDLTCDSMERMETVEFTDSIVMTENSVC